VVASSPSALKRWIGAELKRLRLAAGRSRAEVAERLGKTGAWPGHIETGVYSPGLGDCEVLLTWYGHPERIDFFRKLLAQSKKNKDWWIGFDLGVDAVPEWFSIFLGLESVLRSVSAYEAAVVPGLFQLPEYARAVIHAVHPQLDDVELNRRVELRAARQEILTERADGPPLEIWAILDESALCREIGGPVVWRRQMQHLLKLAELPNVTLQVLPHSSGAHAGIEGAFSVLDFPTEFENDPGVVYVETRVRGIFYEELDDIRVYRKVFDLLRVDALRPKGSIAWISQLLKEAV
jgi:transcriptional regulator with XRE-family HTH domain